MSVVVAALVASILSLIGVAVLVALQFRRRDPIVQLADQISRVREDTGEKIDERLRDLRKDFSELQKSGERIRELSEGVTELKGILDSPQMKGKFGEFELEQMLKQTLPAEHYRMQATIGVNRRVDAAILLPEGALPIDSKLPLETARRLFDSALDPKERESLEKKFAAEIRAHVDSIARKYIVEGETVDLALMFVGIEKVFYEIIASDKLQEYCWKNRVIPVSPNTLHATLRCFRMAFSKVKIEQESKPIVQILGQFLREVAVLEAELGKLRNHLRQAQNTLDDQILTKLRRVRNTLETPEVEKVPEHTP